MRIACLYFRRFAVQIETTLNTGIKGRPVIIGGLPHERKHVFDLSEEALACGVKPGMSVREAHYLCPEGIFLPHRQDRYRETFNTLLDLLDSFSITVEGSFPEAAFIRVPRELDEDDFITNVLRTVESKTGLQASVACASGKFVARAVSQHTGPGEMAIVHQGDEQDAIKDMPVNLLPASAEAQRRLRLLGIRKIGQLAAFSREAASLGFGREGEKLWELARGIDRSRLSPRQKPPAFEDGISLDHPLETTDGLINNARTALARLTPELKRRAQVCRKMTVTMQYDDGNLEHVTAHLKTGASSVEALLQHVSNKLRQYQVKGPVTGMRIALADIRADKGIQGSLFDQKARPGNGLNDTVKQLEKRYGKGTIKRVRASSSGSRLPERSFSFTDFS